MHRLPLVIAALLAVAPAFSAARTVSPSRDDIKAEAKRARQAGDTPSGEMGPREAPFKPAQTRAANRAGATRVGESFPDKPR